jgi:endonuclease YncB( thermonuclease family)
MLLLNLCRATIVSVTDGDTLTVVLDRGRKDKTETKIRLARINAFEMEDEATSEQGKLAKDWLFNTISDETGYKTLLVYTVKNKKFVDQQEKYGRWVAEIWLADEDPYTTPSLNDRLVQNGHAVYMK